MIDWSAPSPFGRRRNPEAAGALRVARPAKGQSVRLLDVALIGPLMIYGGTEASKSATTDLGRHAGNALAVFGLGTIVYNGINYARIERGEGC